MDKEATIAFVQRIYDEVYTAQRADLVDDFYSATCDLADPSLPGACVGTDMIKMLIQVYADALSELRYEVVDIIVDGDRVAFEFRADAVHTGTFQGVAATNKPIHVAGMVMATITDGKVSQVHQYWDQLSLYTQLGIIQLPEPPPA